jgi:hypothetical protein
VNATVGYDIKNAADVSTDRHLSGLSTERTYQHS